MSALAVKLLHRAPVARDTMAFHLSKPAGFVFKPGQAVDLMLPGLGTGDAARHAFSIVSAPFERDLVLATRMRGSLFKNTLKELPLGSALQVDGPFGTMTLHKDAKRAAVFIAGGIGITPYMSMLRQAAREAPRPLVLLYSNRRPEDSAFLAELLQLEQANPRLRLVATMTQGNAGGRQWHGETRRIAEPLLRQVAAELARPVYYLAGPPPMVAAVQAALGRAGVDDEDLRAEAFHGY